MENRFFFKKSWKTQGILKFGKLSGNNHGISQKIMEFLINILELYYLPIITRLKETAKDKKMEIEKMTIKLKVHLSNN